MPAIETHLLGHRPIADHAFSADGSTLAAAVDNTVNVYRRSGKKVELSDQLKGHDKLITGVDIAPRSGRIVTCSQDRNAYVWEPSGSGWKPTLVLPRLNRAATTVRWSPKEDKFAIGSGARLVSICYFEEDGNWWVCKQLKKPFRSTITTVSWHFNNVLLAVGSTDGRARVVSAYIKAIDERPPPTPWGTSLPFNTICLDFLNSSAGWVQDIAFSPDGNALAYVAHDSTLNVVYPSGPDQPPRAALTIMTASLPLASLIWTTDSQIVAAGYDCDVFAFAGSEHGWTLDPSFQKSAKAAGTGSENMTSALQMFRSMDLKGKTENDTSLHTIHQNTITRIRAIEQGPGGVSKFSTSGSDGRVVVWSR